MSIEMIHDYDSREKLQTGINKLANAVKGTLGPKGRYVIIDKPYGSPLITNDGVTIAKAIEFEDKFENMGAKLVKEVSSKTEELSGDGTTTAIILTQSILNQGLRYVNNGASPRFIKSGIEKTTKKLVEELKKIARPVASKEDTRNIATVSSKSEEIGELISDALEKVTKDGVVTVEEGKGFETTIDVLHGYHFDNGFASPYLADDQKNMISTLNELLVLLYSGKINHINEILPLLEQIMPQSKELLIIADDFSEDFISTIVMNKLRGVLNVVLVKAPGYGTDKENILKDLSVLLKTKVYEKANDLKELASEDLGTCNKIEIKKNQTIIFADKTKEIEEYVEELREDAEKNKKRIAKLIGGIGVIKVGANTETEAKEKKMRIEDALLATKAAMEEGVVAGGGIALLKAMENVTVDLINEDERNGFTIVKKAIEEPLKQIVTNCGDSGDVAFEYIKKHNFDIGYDALDGEYKDMFNAGIIDPLKNIRIALENAVSIANLILLTGVAITEKKKEN